MFQVIWSDSDFYKGLVPAKVDYMAMRVVIQHKVTSLWIFLLLLLLYSINTACSQGRCILVKHDSKVI